MTRENKFQVINTLGYSGLGLAFLMYLLFVVFDSSGIPLVDLGYSRENFWAPILKFICSFIVYLVMALIYTYANRTLEKQAIVYQDSLDIISL